MPDRDATARRRTGKRIMIIEGDPDVSSFAVDLMTSCGHTVVHFDSGGAALVRLRMGLPAFDDIISDIVLSDMDGGKFAKLAEPHLAGARIRLLSAYAERCGA